MNACKIACLHTCNNGKVGHMATIGAKVLSNAMLVVYCFMPGTH